MKKGVHYNKVYANVVSWTSIYLLITVIVLHNWTTKQIDYVQAFSQAPAEKDLYLKVPAGFEVEEVNKGDYVLKLQNNVYGQKQAGIVWYRYMTQKLLEELGFQISQVDECVFYRGKTVYILSNDDYILAGPDPEDIEQVLKDLKKANLEVTDEGNIEDFQEINIESKKGKIKLLQPHYIEQVIKDLGLNHNKILSKTIPAASSKVLYAHKVSPPFDDSFHYILVIGKLNYLERSCRPDIAYILHQCARFSTDTRREH